MLSRENRIAIAFAVVALVLGLIIDVFTALPEWVALGVVLAVGLLVPRLYVRLVGDR